MMERRSRGVEKPPNSGRTNKKVEKYQRGGRPGKSLLVKGKGKHGERGESVW